MYKTGTNKPIAFEDVPDAILAYYEKNKGLYDVSVIVGTDSQGFSTIGTKVVSVICVLAEGHGGIFFYETTNVPYTQDVRRKLQMETTESLEVATKLVEAFEREEKYAELYASCPISIHVDAGNSDKGKTKALIPELVGWIKACGYDCQTKPDSFVASTIADRITK